MVSLEEMWSELGWHFKIYSLQKDKAYVNSGLCFRSPLLLLSPRAGIKRLSAEQFGKSGEFTPHCSIK